MRLRSSVQTRCACRWIQGQVDGTDIAERECETEGGRRKVGTGLGVHIYIKGHCVPALGNRESS
jgi:hypothetical protein